MNKKKRYTKDKFEKQVRLSVDNETPLTSVKMAADIRCSHSQSICSKCMFNFFDDNNIQIFIDKIMTQSRPVKYGHRVTVVKVQRKRNIIETNGYLYKNENNAILTGIKKASQILESKLKRKRT